MSIFLLTIDTHHLDHLMAMCQGMDTALTWANQAMATTTILTWLKREDTQHQGILTSTKVLKRREIETTNPLEISMQVCVMFMYYDGLSIILSYCFWACKDFLILILISTNK